MQPNEHSKVPRWSILTWLCVLSPFLLALTWVALAAHVRLGLGHWPKPMWENYHTPLFNIHEWALVLIATFTIFIAIPLWIMLLFFKPFRGSLRFHICQACAYGLGWLLIFILTQFDPTSFTEWFMD